MKEDYFDLRIWDVFWRNFYGKQCLVVTKLVLPFDMYYEDRFWVNFDIYDIHGNYKYSNGCTRGTFKTQTFLWRLKPRYKRIFSKQIRE
jgi:hypothetical protein